MSVQAITWAFAQKVGDPNAKLVLICLANYADHEGACFPSFKTLMSQTEQSRMTVIRKIDALTKLGLLVKRRVYRQGGSQTSNMYYLQLQRGMTWQPVLIQGGVPG
jgi:pyocin large subunit-like protein